MCLQVVLVVCALCINGMNNYKGEEILHTGCESQSGLVREAMRHITESSTSSITSSLVKPLYRYKKQTSISILRLKGIVKE